MSDIEDEEFPTYLYRTIDSLEADEIINEEDNKKKPKLITDFSFLNEAELKEDNNNNIKDILLKSCELSEDKIEKFAKLFDSLSELDSTPDLAFFSLHIIKKPDILKIPVSSKFISNDDARYLIMLDANLNIFGESLEKMKFTDVRHIFNIATSVGPLFNGHGFKYIRYMYKKYPDIDLWVPTPSEIMRTLSYLGGCFPRKFISNPKISQISANLLSERNFGPGTYNNQIKLIISQLLKTLTVMFEHYATPSRYYPIESAVQIMIIFMIVYLDPLVHCTFYETSKLVKSILCYCNDDLDLFYEYSEILVHSLTSDKNKLSLFPLLRNAQKFNKNFMPIYGLVCLYSFLPKLENDKIIRPENYSLSFLTQECCTICKLFLAEKTFNANNIHNIFYVLKEFLVAFHDLHPDEFSKTLLLSMKKINSKIRDTSLTESYVKNQITKMINLYSCLLRSYSTSLF